MNKARWLFLVMAFPFPAIAVGWGGYVGTPPLPPDGLCLAQPRYPGCSKRSTPGAMPSQELWSYFAGTHPWVSRRPFRLSLELALAGALACLLDSPLAAGLLLGPEILLIALEARGWRPAWLYSRPAFEFLIQWATNPAMESYYMYMLFVALTAALLVWRSKNPTPGRSFLSALGVGASLLYRSVLFFLPPVLAVFDAILLKNVLPAKSRRASILILALVPYLMLIPWIRMNWVVWHRVIPTEVNEADGNIVTGAQGIVYSVEGPWMALSPWSPEEERSDRRTLAWAAGETLRHPLRYLVAYVRRLGYVFSLWPVLFSLAVLTLWLYRKEREFQYLGVVIGYYIGIFCMMSIEADYFIPLASILASAAAAGASRMLTRLPPMGAVRRKKGANFSRGWTVKGMGDGVSVAVTMGCLGLALLWSGYSVKKVEAYARVYPSLPENRALTDEGLDRAIRRHPGGVWLLARRGRRELRAKRWRSAVRDFSSALAAQPGNTLWEVSRAWSLARLGRPETLLRGLGGSSLARFLAAAEYWREGNRRLADRELGKIEEDIRRSCLMAGPHDDIKNLPEKDRWAKVRLRAVCRQNYIAELSYAPADFAIPRREADALRAEYARVSGRLNVK